MGNGSQAGIGLKSGLTLLNVTSDPQPVPVGSGVTIINSDIVAVTLSTDNPPTPSNSSSLPPNGAAKPIPAGNTVYISTAVGETATVELIPGLYNIFNPNVLAAPPGSINLVSVNPNIGGYLAQVKVPSGIKTLVILTQVLNTTPVVNVEIVGNTFFQIYYNGPPYFERVIGTLNALQFTQVICPITDAETSYSVFITYGSDPAPATSILQINGDYDRYKESKFYNGSLKVATGSATNDTVTILTGPARLLTASILATGATIGSIQLNGASIISVQGTSASRSVTFPDNTILKSGDNIQVTSINAGVVVVGEIGYAYP